MWHRAGIPAAWERYADLTAAPYQHSVGVRRGGGGGGAGGRARGDIPFSHYWRRPANAFEFAPPDSPRTSCSRRRWPLTPRRVGISMPPARPLDISGRRRAAKVYIDTLAPDCRSSRGTRRESPSRRSLPSLRTSRGRKVDRSDKRNSTIVVWYRPISDWYGRR